MTIADDFDPETFVIANVLDTCAVWNLVSSARLHEAARAGGVSACITGFVHYECLVKARTRVLAEDEELMARMRAALAANQITVHGLDLEDLQEVEALRSRKALGRGELSCIVFAKKVNIAVMSDDRKATKLARAILEQPSRSSTTPRLLGWLLYRGFLDTGEVDLVVRQHKEVRRPLENHYRRIAEIVAGYRRAGSV